MKMIITFKEECNRRFNNYISSYEFVANKFLKVTSHIHNGDTIYTEFYNLDDIDKIDIEEDVREFERRIKVD